MGLFDSGKKRKERKENNQWWENRQEILVKMKTDEAFAFKALTMDEPTENIIKQLPDNFRRSEQFWIKYIKETNAVFHLEYGDSELFEWLNYAMYFSSNQNIYINNPNIVLAYLEKFPEKILNYMNINNQLPLIFYSIESNCEKLSEIFKQYILSKIDQLMQNDKQESSSSYYQSEIIRFKNEYEKFTKILKRNKRNFIQKQVYKELYEELGAAGILEKADTTKNDLEM